MARIDIRSNGAALNDGVLQLENGVAMDATLRKVADQNNTTSPLKLSTTAVQVTSPLRITTSDASGFYLDAEDSATNNRFSIKRDPSAQEVTLDFASNPAGSTTLVGAIRTYRDGVNLSNAMSFIEDGSVGVGTNTPVGLLDLFKSAAATRLAIRGDAGQNRLISYRTGAVQRFGLYVNNTAESGSNAGSNFAIRAYSDAGALLTTPFFINRATGNVGVNTLTGTAKLQVKGSGSTSATTSLLVENSAGTQLISVLDDGKLVVGTTASGLGSIYVPRSSTFGNRNFLFNQDGTALMYTRSNDLIGFNTTVFFNADVNVAGNYRTTLRLTANLSGANSTDSLIINSGTWANQANGTCIGINLQPIIDTDTSSSFAKYIGFYWNPNIADLQSATHYGIQTTSGGAYINTATPNATACLQADSTTQGFLPPRMTNAQRGLITTPAIGLMVYCTDAVEGLYVYKSTGWTFVI